MPTLQTYFSQILSKLKRTPEILDVYIINSVTKSYILNIKIRPFVTEYALRINLVGGNPYAYFGHLWSYFDIQNLRLVILHCTVKCTHDYK
jgi:hypothetical protein